MPTSVEFSRFEEHLRDDFMPELDRAIRGSTAAGQEVQRLQKSYKELQKSYKELQKRVEALETSRRGPDSKLPRNAAPRRELVGHGSARGGQQVRSCGTR